MVLLLGCAYAEDSTAVPQLVKFSGTISGAPAGTVSVIFALYKDQTGGAPLWQEVQNLAVDASGHYTSLLGARSASGIPVEVFSNGEARWLGVEAERQPEQPRVLLVSVPYALKASDAETLGGLPASAFLRAVAVPINAPPSVVPASYVNTAAVTAAVNNAVAAAITVSNPTLGYVPYFYDAGGDLKNSSLFQATTGYVGVGTTTPVALLSLLGTNPSMRIENYSNTPGDSPNFNFYSGRGTATTPLATQSGDNLGQFASSGYNGAAFPGSKVKVSFMATENWTAAANGTAMSLATTTNGTTARTERMRIDNTGNVGIGTSTPAFPLSVNGVVQSMTGGFRFPDGTTQTTAVSITVNGDTLTSPDSSITVGGTSAAPTVKVNTTIIQQRVTGTCASGSAIASIGSTGTVGCQTVGGGGGITLPVNWSGAATAPAGVLNVTDTANGPVETQGSLPNASTVPAAIVGTASGTGASLGVLGVTIDGAGISGFATGTEGFGVFASSIHSFSPAMYAGNFLTGYAPTGLDPWPIGVMAHVSNGPGIALEADAVASSSPACAAGTKECYGTIGVNSDVYATSGPITVFHGHAYSASANGLWLDFFTAPTSGAMIRAGLTSGTGPSFVVDGSANVTTSGNLHVGGTLTKASGTFKIDHPLDPANKYLSHSFVESPDMMNIYNGNIVTDRHGNATVELPSYFEALNQDFRYQLTVIGQFAQAIVVREIAGNRFTIKTSKPAVKVSWQVTGVRHDAYAEAHRVVVEEAKPEQERGTYLHPELFHAAQYIAEKK
jgi:hypothetical protein